MTNDQFQHEVIDRLARIEQDGKHIRRDLRDHTEEDEGRFEVVEAELKRIAIEEAVAKRAGRGAALKTAAPVGGAVVALAEIARAILG